MLGKSTYFPSLWGAKPLKELLGPWSLTQWACSLLQNLGNKQFVLKREGGLRGSWGGVQLRSARPCAGSGCVKGMRALCGLGGGRGHLDCRQPGVFRAGLEPGYPATPACLSPFFSSFFTSRSFSTLWGSLSHSRMRTKGSRPFKLSLCQGLGLDSRSDTEPCVSPRMLSPNNRCPGDRAEGNCHLRPSAETHSQESQRGRPGR